MRYLISLAKIENEKSNNTVERVRFGCKQPIYPTLRPARRSVCVCVWNGMSMGISFVCVALRVKVNERKCKRKPDIMHIVLLVFAIILAIRLRRLSFRLGFSYFPALCRAWLLPLRHHC